MAQPKIVFQVRQVNEMASIIDIQGELTALAEQALMQAYTDGSSSTTRRIILNFTGLEYMNSSGIGLLITLLIRVNRQKQRLLSFGLSDHYRHIFALTRINDAINNFASEDEAIKAAG
jgi:anti-sigma B factor antagonist